MSEVAAYTNVPETLGEYDRFVVSQEVINQIPTAITEAAVAADGSQRVETLLEPRQFECLRHGDVRRFVSWKTYLQHCAYNKEAPEEKAPDDVLEMAKRFTFFCFLHNKGFMFKRTAVHHLKNELRKPGRAVHPGLEQMTVNKGG